MLKNNPRYGSHPPDIFSKLAIWLMTDYEWAVFFAADCLFYANVDNAIETIVTNAKKTCNFITTPNFIVDFDGNTYGTGAGLCSSFFLTKPNINIFIELFKNINNMPYEETLFYYAWMNNILIPQFTREPMVHTSYIVKKYWTLSAWEAYYYEFTTQENNRLPIECYKVGDLPNNTPHPYGLI